MKVFAFVVTLAACNGSGSSNPGGGQGAGDEESLNEATLTLVAQYPLGGNMDGVPYTLAIDGTVFASGLTGAPLLVGSGNFTAQIGPSITESHPDDPYYPDEADGYTDDGLPMIIKDDRRYVHAPFEVSIGAPQDTETVVMTAMLGEAYYTCHIGIYAYDPSRWESRGAEVTLYTLELQWIDFLDGRVVAPADAATFGNALQPGDALVIAEDGYSLVLATETDNTIEPYWPEGWREGTGLNDFAFNYLNPTDASYADEGITGTVTTLRCLYDWWPYPSEEE